MMNNVLKESARNLLMLTELLKKPVKIMMPFLVFLEPLVFKIIQPE